MSKRLFSKLVLCLTPIFLMEAATDITNSSEVIEQLVNGNYEKPSDLHMLQLFQVAPDFYESIVAEVLNLISTYRPSKVTTQGHLSNWSKPEGTITQFSLLNYSGKLDDYSDDHDRSFQGKKFHHSEKYPHLAKFISLFPHATNFRINILHEKSCFTQHQEDLCFFHRITKQPSLRVRFHLPIKTHDEALMLSNGQLFHFNPGIVYFFHNGTVHDGINQSSTESRVHLLWDMLLTQDTFDRMFKRSIDSPLLYKLDTIEMAPIKEIGIDPLYKKTRKKMLYETALTSVLCPVQ